jgi:hypothetical protein
MLELKIFINIYAQNIIQNLFYNFLEL